MQHKNSSIYLTTVIIHNTNTAIAKTLSVNTTAVLGTGLGIKKHSKLKIQLLILLVHLVLLINHQN